MAAYFFRCLVDGREWGRVARRGIFPSDAGWMNPANLPGFSRPSESGERSRHPVEREREMVVPANDVLRRCRRRRMRARRRVMPMHARRRRR